MHPVFQGVELKRASLVYFIVIPGEMGKPVSLMLPGRPLWIEMPVGLIENF